MTVTVVCQTGCVANWRMYVNASTTSKGGHSNELCCIGILLLCWFEYLDCLAHSCIAQSVLNVHTPGLFDLT